MSVTSLHASLSQDVNNNHSECDLDQLRTHKKKCNLQFYFSVTPMVFKSGQGHCSIQVIITQNSKVLAVTESKKKLMSTVLLQAAWQALIITYTCPIFHASHKDFYDIPVGPLTLMLYSVPSKISWPSFSHRIRGSGMPVTEQFRCTVMPSGTRLFFSLAVKSGATWNL